MPGAVPSQRNRSLTLRWIRGEDFPCPLCLSVLRPLIYDHSFQWKCDLCNSQFDDESVDAGPLVLGGEGRTSLDIKSAATAILLLMLGSVIAMLAYGVAWLVVQ